MVLKLIIYHYKGLSPQKKKEEEQEDFCQLHCKHSTNIAMFCIQFPISSYLF